MSIWKITALLDDKNLSSLKKSLKSLREFGLDGGLRDAALDKLES